MSPDEKLEMAKEIKKEYLKHHLDEAHYICAILNSKIVERYIYATSDSRSFRIRPPVLLPKYDKDKELHRRLSELSQIASKDFDKLDHIRDQIDEIYLAICSRG